MARPKKVKEPSDEPIVKVPITAATNGRKSNYGFNFMDEAETIKEQVQKTVHTISARRKNKSTGFKSLDEVRREMLPMKDFPVQYLTGNYGIPEKSLIEILGAGGVGKSTLCHYLEGQAVLAGCPVYHQECENKPLKSKHVARIVHKDKALARKITKAIHFDKARSLEESWEKLIDWIEIMRGKRSDSKVEIPIHVPLLAVIDPWGKLMSPDEAKGNYDYGDNMKEKAKDMMTASNLGHAKAAHRWVRQLPHIMDTNNVTLILVQHQNDKINMTAMRGPAMDAETSAMHNITKVGGNAFNQLDSMQIIVGRKGLVKSSSGDNIGKTIKLRMHKNSYGPESRVIEYDLINDGFVDTETTQSPVIRFERWFSEWMTEKGYIGSKITAKRVTCDTLGLTGATYTEFYDTFHANEEVLAKVAMNLKIDGYDLEWDEDMKTIPEDSGEETIENEDD